MSDVPACTLDSEERLKAEEEPRAELTQKGRSAGLADAGLPSGTRGQQQNCALHLQWGPQPVAPPVTGAGSARRAESRDHLTAYATAEGQIWAQTQETESDCPVTRAASPVPRAGCLPPSASSASAATPHHGH